MKPPHPTDAALGADQLRASPRVELISPRPGGSDTLVSGVRTIPLVAGGVALRIPPSHSLLARSHLDVVTIKVPEPGANIALILTLACLAAGMTLQKRAYSVRS